MIATARKVFTGSGPKADRPLIRALEWLSILSVVVTILGFGGRFSWLCELCANFRPQLFVAQLVIAALWIWNGKPLAALLMSICAVINLAVIWPHYAQSLDFEGHAEETLTVGTVNVHWRNDEYDAVIKLLNDLAPDVVVLQEMTPEWSGTLDRLGTSYPYSVLDLRQGQFGIALLSRYPIVGHRRHLLGPRKIPVVEARIEHQGAGMTFIGAHLEWPLTPSGYAMRSEQFRELAAIVSRAARPTVVCGDFNTPPWSDWFAFLIRKSGGTGSGYNVGSTWPGALGPLGLPIDNCVFSSEMSGIKRKTAPVSGSDHRMLITILGWNNAGP